MRRVIIGAAIACYAAALIISAAALGVPVSNPAVSLPHRLPAATLTPPREATAPGAALVPETKTPPTPATPATVGNEPSEEDSLLLLAEQTRLAGDQKKTKAIYLRLLRDGKHRDLAAQRLGDLYFDAGEFRRAEELYRESARLLRESSLPTQKPLLP
jgi:tetratricopeptide (TPR) repeat protein